MKTFATIISMNAPTSFEGTELYWIRGSSHIEVVGHTDLEQAQMQCVM